MRVVAVVPVYRPDAALTDLVAALLDQVDHVVLVVDGPDAARRTLLDDLATSGAEVVTHTENRGIAAALNTGVAVALARGVDAVLTVDQDSLVPAGFVPVLLSAWAKGRDAGLAVGLVAPEYLTGIPSQVTEHRGGTALGRDPVQSGLLVPVGTVERVGPFDEGLFIDGVDADYALRVLDAELVVVVAEGLSLGHRLGATHQVSVAGVRVGLTRSAPFRYYYLARNRSRLVRRHARRHPGWAAGQTLGLVRHLAVTTILVPGRRERLGETGRGLRDAVRGRAGRRPER